MPFSPSAAAGSTIAICSTIIEGVEGIPEFGGKRAWIESVPINALAKLFVADIADYGMFTLVGERQKSDAGQAALLAASQAVPAVDKTFVVTFSGSGDVATFQAKVGSFMVSGNKGATQRFSSEVKISGVVNWA